MTNDLKLVGWFSIIQHQIIFPHFALYKESNAERGSNSRSSSSSLRQIITTTTTKQHPKKMGGTNYNFEVINHGTSFRLPFSFSAHFLFRIFFGEETGILLPKMWRGIEIVVYGYLLKLDQSSTVFWRWHDCSSGISVFSLRMFMGLSLGFVCLILFNTNWIEIVRKSSMTRPISSFLFANTNMFLKNFRRYN